jgi:protein-S-isoprenylcysteine O-methyltransferase Ste14
MRTFAALAGSAVFLLLAPGVMAGLIPWWLTGWEGESPWVLRVVGAVLVVLGAVALLWSFLRFALEGAGTPAPVAPTERLVVGGLYRYVRNPMYVAVTATIAGQALLLGRTILVVYAALFATLTAAFVRLYEEPTLRERYGEEYEAYRRAVPGWWPRRPRSTPPRGVGAADSGSRSEKP